MKKDGLTLTMVFLAESANYGEGVGNITTLKKMTRGDYQQYSYISRQAIRYNLVQQLNWDDTPVDGKSGVVQFAPSATIKDYPEIDLFGYMKTTSKDDNLKGGATTRSAVARLSNAISLEPYQGELEFLTNMGLAKRQNLGNAIAQSEIHRAYYTYTLSIDLDRVGEDVDISISPEQKTERVNALLDAIQYLYRDIKGRRENLSPLFVIGGNYARKNPFFENCVRIKNNSIRTGAFLDLMQLEKLVAKREVGIEKNKKFAHPGGPCLIGVHKFFVNADGNFYPCERVDESANVTKIGNIKSGFDFDRIRELLNIGKLTENECKNCWAFQFCIQCFRSAVDGDKLSKEKRLAKCKSSKMNAEESIKDYIVLKEYHSKFGEGLRGN